jgi:ASC-1-like (ASCH) protein
MPIETPFQVIAIKLHRKVWMGTTQLFAEEVGLKEDEIPDNVKLGHKKLYPRVWLKGFNNIIAGAKYFLSNNSLPHIVENIRALPNKRLATVIEGLEEYQRQFTEHTEAFLAAYEAIQKEWQDKYPEQWEQNQKFYPPVEKLRKKFQFYWDVFRISGISANEVDPEDIQEAYRRGMQRLDERVAEMAETGIALVRARVFDSFDTLANAIGSGKIVKPQTLASAKEAMEWFRDMNIYDDFQVEERLRDARQVIERLEAGDLKDSDIAGRVRAACDAVTSQLNEAVDINAAATNYRRKIGRIEDLAA